MQLMYLTPTQSHIKSIAIQPPTQEVLLDNSGVEQEVGGTTLCKPLNSTIVV